MAVSAALLATGGAAGAQSEPSPAVVEQHDLVYATVDGEPILLDAFLPATAPKKRPAVVLDPRRRMGNR